MFTLSILAELIRQSPQIKLTYKSEFLKSLFEIDLEEIDYASRNRLLLILAVFYNNLSQQSAQLRELKMQERLKLSLLLNYAYLEDAFTTKLFNQSMMQ